MLAPPTPDDAQKVPEEIEIFVSAFPDTLSVGASEWAATSVLDSISTIGTGTEATGAEEPDH